MAVSGYIMVTEDAGRHRLTITESISVPSLAEKAVVKFAE
jgi:hypothetical protein